MDAVTLALAKKHTNEQVIQKATNSPTETISFDCGAYSLPSTVVNGQVSDVRLLGNTYTNIVKNGNFADGTPNWITTASNLTVDGNTAIVTGNGISVYPRISQSNITSYGEQKKIYVRARVKVNNSSCNLIKIELLSSGMSTVDITLNTPTENTWYTHSGIISLPPGGNAQNNVSIQIAQRYSDVDTANGKVMEVQEVVAIDMGTSASDPLYNLTAEEMNMRFPHWFNGTKSTNSVRVKSVGKNLFDKSRKPDEVLSNGIGFECKDILEVGKTYTLSGVGGVSTKISKTQGSSEQILHYNKATPRTFTWTQVAKDDNYKLYFWKLDISDMNVQLEEGTTATEYEPYKESIVNVNLPEPLRSLPNGVKDEVNVSLGKVTWGTGKYYLAEEDITGYNITGNDYVDIILLDNLGTKINAVPFLAYTMRQNTLEGFTQKQTASRFADIPSDYVGSYYNSGTLPEGNEHRIRIVVAKGTYATLADARADLAGTALTYQLAEPIVTKLPAQPPLQIYENGTVYVEPIGDASESTLPSVEMTIPTGTSNKFGVATHDYGGAAADWVLTNSESKCFLLAVSNADGAANIIAPDAPGVMYAISNASGHTITIKISGGAGGAGVADSKTVLVIHNGTDYTALTAEL